MAISDTQKIDTLFKKVIYGVTKTDVAGNKSPSNEAIASPALVRGDVIWNQSGLIPSTPPSSTEGVVQVRTGTSKVAASADPTVVPSTRSWISGVTKWIPPQFGSAYAVKVYADTIGATNPQLTGTLLAPDGINSDAYTFDYEAGVLNFADTNVPAALSGKTIFLVGYTYVGTLGAGAGGSYGDLLITGATISTSITNGNVTIEGNGTGGVVLNDQTTVNGTLTSTGNVTAPGFEGNVTSTGLSTFANVDINGGTIDGTVIGGTTPAAGTFTTVVGGAATFTSINNTPVGNAVPSTGAFTTLASNGLTTITNTTESSTPANGALVVAGGVGIGMNLNVDGNVVVTGNLTVEGSVTTVSSTELTVTDKNITVAQGAVSSSAADGAGLTVAGPAAATILYVDADNSWTLNKIVNAPTINSTATADSTSPTTGSLTTDGGAGVAKDLWVGGTIHGNVTTANLQATGGDLSSVTVTATSLTTANAQISGGAITATPVSGSTGSFTTLASSGAASLNSVVTANAQVTGGAITGTPVSGSTGSFTTMSTPSATITGGAIDNTTIGATTPSTGAFTSLSSTLGFTGNVLTAAQPAITSLGTQASNLAMGGFKITNLADPTSALDATNKTYVDNLVSSGTRWEDPVRNPDLCGIANDEPTSPIASGLYIAYGASPGFPQSWSTINKTAGVTITNGGSGYTLGSAVSFGGGGTAAVGTVTSVDGGGAVTAITITNGGHGYSSPTVSVAGGSGFVGSVSLISVAAYDMMHYTRGEWQNSGALASGTRLLAGVFTLAVDVTAGQNLTGTGIAYADLVQYVGGPSSDPSLAANWSFPSGRVGGVTFGIESATAGTGTFEIAGDVRPSFHGGNTFKVAGTASNNGTFHIETVTYVGPNTNVVVTESVVTQAAPAGTAEPEMADGTTTLTNNVADSHYGQTYLYDVGQDKWTQIAGPGSISTGSGLSYAGTVLNVNTDGTSTGINGSNQIEVVGVGGSIISFIIGLVDGYLRPLKCRKK